MATANFWLVTLDMPVPAGATASPAAPLHAARSRKLAIEVISMEGEFAVLFSTVDDLQHPTRLTCRVGFANSAKACSVWRDRGFPLVDGSVDYDGKTLQVTSPYFADPAAPQSDAMQYETALVAISGLEFAPQAGSRETLSTSYEQFEETPDGAWPATWITRTPVSWKPERSNIRVVPIGTVDLEVTATRSPSLVPFAGKQSLQPAAAWSGEVTLPRYRSASDAKPARVARADAFGTPVFRFEDVEILGFRVDLAAFHADPEAKLEALIKDLNFHLDCPSGGNAITDFRYRPATSTLLIELLRYGSMKVRDPAAPLSVHDYQCQHELLVRVLVGRVDDDTSQARSPAVYVPAIFVDNPWSKMLGRQVQGFDKRLAYFCVNNDTGVSRLSCDGRAVDPKLRTLGNEPEALARISTVRLVEKVGSLDGPTILELNCSPEAYGNWDAFENVDLQLALGSSALAGTRWQQTDFESPEFRRSFANSAVAQDLRGFRSIQVSPVTDRPLDKTWISGNFEIDDDIQMVRPSGIVSLKLNGHPAAPKNWRLFCEMFGTSPVELSFPTGTWYRLKCAMDLTISNALD